MNMPRLHVLRWEGCRAADLSWAHVVTLSLLLAAGPAQAADDPIDFARDIRPLLSTACLHCHGPDEASREADLRLDSREDAFLDRGGYAAVVPGEPEKSEAYRRIISSDPDLRMPPPDSGHSLDDEEISLIRKWIEQGGEWTRHWAFEPPLRPDVPDLPDSEWVHNPIDAFILAELNRQGLRPAADADSPTLLRRLHLDLVGLPPTTEETGQSVGTSAGFEAVVERLLDSPHYGERWGRIWLDAARYADSDGFEKDKPRNVWMYRDWVVKALNQDLPYDQFIVEQIAGDLLPNATQDQVVATGFLRNSMLNEEGGIDPEQFRMEAMFDRLDAVGKSVLGLTIQCGQCHDHKYDPLAQADYYRMFALLNNSYEANVAAYGEGDLRQRLSILSQIEQIESRLKTDRPSWKEDLLRWAEVRRAEQPEWQLLRIENANDNSQRYYPQADGSILAQGYAPTRFDALFRVTTDMPSIRGFRLEMIPDPNLPVGGPGRSVDGLFALTEFKVEVANPATPDQKQWVKFTQARADFANDDRRLRPLFADRSGKTGLTGKVDYAIDGSDDTAWGVDAGPGRRNRRRQAVFSADRDVALPNGTMLTFHFVQKHGGWNSDDNQNMNLGRFRVLATGSELAEIEDPLLPAEVAAILERDTTSWDESDWQQLFSHWRTEVPQWAAANAEIESLWQQHPAGTTQLVLAERSQMRPTFRLERGDFLQPLEQVEPGVPGFLHSLEESSAPDRLDFARWLVDRRSPTTARAIVNRVWQAYFGRGLVSTPEDLGVQGALPTHPELLDWLAVELMDHGWSLKHLHRLIVHSHTYRQSAAVSAELLQRDPDNRLLARGARYRVDAEVVRDIALAASGLLDRSVGGPSVYPPAPEFLFQPPASYGPKTWVQDDPGKYRRALYTFRFRSTPYPALEVFDAPNGDTACVRRDRSNSPLQALTTLNEPLFFECAQALARSTYNSEGDLPKSIERAFRSCVARSPKADEVRLLSEMLGDVEQQLTDDAAAELVGPAAKEMELAQLRKLASWTAVCRVILNLDETYTRE